MRHWFPVKRRSSRAVGLVLLALQVVLGFQLQAVQAVASPASMRMPLSTHVATSSPATLSHAGAVAHVRDLSAVAHASDADLSAYSNAVDAAAQVRDPSAMARASEGHLVVHAADSDAAALVADDDQATQPDCSQHSMPHDCCHASACQCHCVYTPGVIDVPALSNIATSVAVPSLATTQFVAPLIDEFLRPPIA